MSTQALIGRVYLGAEAALILPSFPMTRLDMTLQIARVSIRPITNMARTVLFISRVMHRLNVIYQRMFALKDLAAVIAL